MIKTSIQNWYYRQFYQNSHKHVTNQFHSIIKFFRTIQYKFKPIFTQFHLYRNTFLLVNSVLSTKFQYLNASLTQPLFKKILHISTTKCFIPPSATSSVLTLPKICPDLQRTCRQKWEEAEKGFSLKRVARAGNYRSCAGIIVLSALLQFFSQLSHTCLSLNELSGSLGQLARFLSVPAGRNGGGWPESCQEWNGDGAPLQSSPQALSALLQAQTHLSASHCFWPHPQRVDHLQRHHHLLLCSIGHQETPIQGITAIRNIP